MAGCAAEGLYERDPREGGGSLFQRKATVNEKDKSRLQTYDLKRQRGDLLHVRSILQMGMACKDTHALGLLPRGLDEPSSPVPGGLRFIQHLRHVTFWSLPGLI